MSKKFSDSSSRLFSLRIFADASSEDFVPTRKGCAITRRGLTGLAVRSPPRVSAGGSLHTTIGQRIEPSRLRQVTSRSRELEAAFDFTRRRRSRYSSAPRGTNGSGSSWLCATLLILEAPAGPSGRRARFSGYSIGLGSRRMSTFERGCGIVGRISASGSVIPFSTFTPKHYSRRLQKTFLTDHRPVSRG
jgi:hypothetical protein